MIETLLYTYMFAHTLQCSINDRPIEIEPEIRYIYIEVEKEEEVEAVEEVKPVLHVPTKTSSIRQYTDREYKRSIFNPKHPNFIKTQYHGEEN